MASDIYRGEALLKSMLSPHDIDCDDGTHGLRKCRHCLAWESAECRKGEAELKAVLDDLQRLREENARLTCDLLEQAKAAHDAREEARGYRCYHCHNVFYDDDMSARIHFGTGIGDVPKCLP